MGWCSLFSSANVQHVTAACSDHTPICLKFSDELAARRGAKPFKYELMWETHPELKPFVDSGWRNNPESTMVQDLQEKLKQLSGNLSRWDRQTFGNVRREIKRMKHELEILQGVVVRSGPSAQELKITEQLMELYHREEILWKQRSRVH